MTASRIRAAGLGPATIVLCSLTVVSHSLCRSLYGLLVPAIEDDLGLAHAETGFGASAIYVAYFLGVVSVAWLAPRLEPIALARGGIVFGIVGLGVLATATGLPSIVIGLSLCGLATAGIWLPAPTLATVGVTPSRRGLVIGLMSGTIGVATFISAFGTNLARSVTGNESLWRPIVVVGMLTATVIFIGMVVVVRQPKTDPLKGGFSFTHLRAVPGWGRLTLAYSLYGAIAAAISAFLLAAMEQDAGLSRSQASAVFGLMGIGAVIGAPSFGALSDRIGRPKTMTVTLVIIVGGTFALAFANGIVVAIAVTILGSSWGSFPMLTATYLRDHADERFFSTAFASMTAFYSAVGFVAPWTVGFFADQTGSFRWPFSVLGVMAIVATGLVSGLPGRPSAKVAAA